jgi:hypothetical protein
MAGEVDPGLALLDVAVFVDQLLVGPPTLPSVLISTTRLVRSAGGAGAAAHPSPAAPPD